MQAQNVPAQYGPAWRCLALAIRKLAPESRASFDVLAHALAGFWPDVPGVPEAETRATFAFAAEVLEGATISRGARAGRLLARARKDSTAEVRAFLACYWWHAGATGGSLWGPMMGGMMYGQEAYERADTLASVVRIALGLPMAAADAWARALGTEVSR